MRTKTMVIVIAVLVVALLFGNLSLADEDNTGEDELILAMQAATSRLAGYTGEDVVFPEFEGADLVSSQPYYDLEGDLICHMFGIGSEGEILGTIVVGSSAYDNRILEVFDAPPPSVPSNAKVREYLETCLGMQADEAGIGEPERLLHLGPASDWALYDVKGEAVAVHLWTELAAQASDLKFTMSTPEQMRQYDEMRELELTGRDSKEILEIKTLPVPMREMNDDAIPEDMRNNNNCGPTSAAMISGYHKEYHELDSLPSWPADHNVLYDTMHCNDPFWGVDPGFVSDDMSAGWEEYSDIYGYCHFEAECSFCYTSGVNDYTYYIMPHIRIENPLMVCFTILGPNLHWNAIRGYIRETGEDYIVCNDPWGFQRYVNWANVHWTTWLGRLSRAWYDIDLKTGDNLISLPVDPVENAIEDVLDSVVNYVSTVWHYDAEASTWYSWAPWWGGDLTAMDEGKGYFVMITSDCTLTVVGNDPQDPVQKLELDAFSGWNMLGSLYVDGEWKSNPSGMVVEVQGWDADLQEFYIETEKMESSKGYWVNVSENCDNCDIIITPKL